MDRNKYATLAAECIGLHKGKTYSRGGKKFFRPTYNAITVPPGKVQGFWMDLVGQGYAKMWKKNRDGSRDFWLTRAGLDWLGGEFGVKIQSRKDEDT